MAAAIGRALSELEQQGHSENTFVLFTSDNGSYHENSNGTFRGEKSYVWEGGIRVPAIIRWPKHIKPGTTSNVPCGGVDLMPTICELAGIKQPADRAIDGSSITPIFNGGQIHRETPLFWFFYRMEPACAMREGDWSLIGYLDTKVPPEHGFYETHMPYVKNAKLNRFELYKIKQDPGQSKNVAKENPELFEVRKKKFTFCPVRFIPQPTRYLLFQET